MTSRQFRHRGSTKFYVARRMRPPRMATAWRNAFFWLCAATIAGYAIWLPLTR